jgi:hypothetical protein
MSSSTEGRAGFRDLLSRDDLIIETLMILAIAIFMSFCATWEFVQTWTPSVTTWAVIEKIQMDALTTYWGLLAVPYIVMFAYLTSTVVAWDKGTVTANAMGQVSRRTPLVLMAFVIVSWAVSVIVYMAVLWAFAVPLPNIAVVFASSFLPFAALVLICGVVLSSLVLVNERGFTNGMGLVLMIVLLMAATWILARYWFM